MKTHRLASSRAALIYQHATQERHEAIAAGTGKLPPQACIAAPTALRRATPRR